MGAGAVGSYFGAKLAKCGVDVVFVGRGDHLLRMRRNGLEVKSVDGDFHIFAHTAPTPADAGEVDLLLFTVKAYDAAEAARTLKPMLGAETTVLPLQNGVESEDLLAGLYGPQRVLGGLCYVGAMISRPGEVIHSASGKIILGEMDGRVTIRTAQVENLLTEAEIPVKVSTSIMADKWRKLAWNISFNAVSALTGQTVGRILDVEGTREIIRAAISETVKAADAIGVSLDRSLPEKIIEESEVFRNLKTSMLQDAERGKRLEYDALNGAVRRAGAKGGVPTPVNDLLYGLLSSMDPAPVT